MTNGRASRLQGLEAFVETADAGGFAAAAQRLGLTRSAVAKSVARLEAHLGVRLLVRTTRSVALTPEGQVFFEACARTLNDLDRAEACLSSRRAVVSGELTVSLPVSFGYRWIAPLLLDFAENHPDLRLTLDFTDRFIRPDEEGVDLAVRIGGANESETLISRRLALHHTQICAAPAYVARFGAPASIDDLGRHRCINFAHEGRITPWRLREPDGRERSFRPRSYHTVSHGDALLDAVLAGHGIASLPTWLTAPGLRAGTLVSLLPEGDTDPTPIRLLWPERRSQLPRVRAAIDALIAGFTPQSPWDTPADDFPRQYPPPPAV